MKSVQYIPLVKEYRTIGWVCLPHFLDKAGKSGTKIHGNQIRRFIHADIDYRCQRDRVGVVMKKGLSQEGITTRRWRLRVTDQPVTLIFLVTLDRQEIHI